MMSVHAQYKIIIAHAILLCYFEKLTFHLLNNRMCVGDVNLRPFLSSIKTIWLVKKSSIQTQQKMDVEPRSSGGTPPHTSSSTYTFDFSTGTSLSTIDSSSREDVRERLECVALSLEDETPPVRSLLCPAHWGALLESTTVSLVSTMREHAWDTDVKILRPLATEQDNLTSCGAQFERGAHTPDSVSGNGDDTKTPQGGQSPQR